MDCEIIVLALPSGFLIDSYGWHSCHIMTEFVLTNLSSAMEVPQASGVVIRAGEQPALMLEQLARVDGSCVAVVRFDFDLGATKEASDDSESFDRGTTKKLITFDTSRVIIYGIINTRPDFFCSFFFFFFFLFSCQPPQDARSHLGNSNKEIISARCVASSRRRKKGKLAIIGIMP